MTMVRGNNGDNNGSNDANDDASLLKVILPPCRDTMLMEDDDMRDLEALRLIDTIGKRILPKREVQDLLSDTIEEGVDTSVRKIQAERYEIFFHDAVDKGCNCVDKILQMHGLDPQVTKRTIVGYAIARAQKDTRLHGKAHKYGNFSLIVNYGAVDAQAPHIDLLLPNYQFGLLMTTGPGTVSYQTEHKIQTVEDLRAAWERTDAMDMEKGLECEPLPERLIQAMYYSRDVRAMLRGYGDILVPDEELVQAATNEARLPAGTVCSLPGGVVHAGPKTNQFRAVLFFSALPLDSGCTEYHPDTQYSSVFLCSRLIQLLWRFVGIGYTERKYLLRKLYRYIRQGGATEKHERVKREWALHFAWDPLTAFIANVELDMASFEADMELIKTTALNETLCFFNVLGSEDGFLKGDFRLMSKPNLFTRWEDKVFPIRIYERPLDGKVLMFYPEDDSESGFSWEGIDPGEHYTLVRYVSDETSMMDASSTGKRKRAPWFNGANGALLDTEGCEVKCHLRLRIKLKLLGVKRESPSPISSDAQRTRLA